VHPVGFQNPFDRTLPPPEIVVVIPARYEAVRLPGKPLAEIDGRSMIEHVYRRAAAARGVDAVVVATDDQRIADAVAGFGGVVRMTSPAHRTGTDRIAEVARDLACGIVVNVQGDEPLLEPTVIDQIIAPLRENPQLEMSTACCALRDRTDYANPNVVKVVSDAQGRALYFSRAPVPHLRTPVQAARQQPAASTAPAQPAMGDSAAGAGLSSVVRKHLGLYAYRRAFLLAFAALPQTPLELAESLEQLRALEHGHRIQTVYTEHDSIGVDTPEELDRVRRHFLAAAARS
jgi:3-deoxy-manno-octulosonate cytidylyltransferase (CMP-KDO synthetase)